MSSTSSIFRSPSGRSRSPSDRSRSPSGRSRSPANGRLRVLEISAGGSHSFVLLSNGQVLSFGDGRVGQLGHGGAEDLSVPTAIPRLSTATAVAAGEAHSLVLLRSGQVLSFGLGRGGRLGHGDAQDLLVPTAIPGLSTATAVSAGTAHSLVLLRNGRVLSFGEGRGGRLGHGGDEQDLLVPTAIPGLSTATAVAAGGVHSLVLLSNGRVLSFGHGSAGRLGHGDAQDLLVPTAIPGLSTATAVAAGGGHSLVLLSDGQVLSFGVGTSGQLGHGNTRNLLVPAAIPGLTTATAVAAGKVHSLVLLRSGQVLSFGEGILGQLGHGGRRLNLLVPAAIPGLSMATAVSAGSNHSLVLLRSGQVLSFGLGSHGRLGHGNAPLTLSVPMAIPIPGLTTATPAPVPIVNEEEEGLLINENLNPEEAFDLLQHENVPVNSSLTDDRVLFIVVPAVGPRAAFIFDLEDVKTMVADRENHFYPCRGLNTFPLANAPTYVKISLTTNFYFLLSNVQKVVRPTQRSRIFYIVPAWHPGTATQKAFEFTCSWTACRSPEPDYVGRAHCQEGSEIVISKFEECRAVDAVSCLQSLAARRPAV
jgi:alpha-tubulin suppressor-like RCC1 family protein